MGIVNPIHLVFIAAIALVVLGPKRLPELARSLGHGMREFRESLNDVMSPNEAGETPVTAHLLPDEPVVPATPSATVVETPAAAGATVVETPAGSTIPVLDTPAVASATVVQAAAEPTATIVPAAPTATIVNPVPAAGDGPVPPQSSAV